MNSTDRPAPARPHSRSADILSRVQKRLQDIWIASYNAAEAVVGMTGDLGKTHPYLQVRRPDPTRTYMSVVCVRAPADLCRSGEPSAFS